MSEPVETLPEGTVLLHIGVHKTGTTSLQYALSEARPQLAQAGVLYPTDRTAHHTAAWGVAERKWGWGDKARPADPADWEKLVKETRKHRGTVVISSEFFAVSRKEVIPKVVEGLGADRVHVVVTARPLGRLLPSSWQQYLKFGLTATYEDWLRDIFADPPKSTLSPAFWRRSDYSRLINNWLEHVPADRFTVVMSDETDRKAIFRAFEQMLGLPGDTLWQYAGDAPSNRSLTAGESELLRQVNARLKPDMDWQRYRKVVRDGLAKSLVENRTPGADEPRVVTPAWALSAAVPFQHRAAKTMRKTGVRVIGDLDRFEAEVPSAGDPVPGDMVAVDAALEAIESVYSTARRKSVLPERLPDKRRRPRFHRSG